MSVRLVRPTSAAAGASTVKVRTPAKVAGNTARSGKAGGCGSGAGGFKPGNKCGAKGGGSAGTSQPKGRGGSQDPSDGRPAVLQSSSPEVQAAHARINRGIVRENDPHADHVREIRQAMAAGERHHVASPQAIADAKTIGSYTPAVGTPAVGMKPGIPNASTNSSIRQAKIDIKKGIPISSAEHSMLIDAKAARVQHDSDGTRVSDTQGHRFLVHNRFTGEHDFVTEAELHAYPERSRARLRGANSDDTVIRQFDSQGVEVPVNHARYLAALHPDAKLSRERDYKQNGDELAHERRTGKSAPRAAFGTATPLVKTSSTRKGD